uniref:KIAA1324 like n=1 Tax=Sinocyclocheilus rhinocerous TaxID=307959 RepID=A0A673KWQ1_9TELE
MGRSRYSIRQAMERTRKTIVRHRGRFALDHTAWICFVFILNASVASAAHLRPCNEVRDHSLCFFFLWHKMYCTFCYVLRSAFSCKAGEFLEMSAQECTPCAAGTYSLGSGLRLDEWGDIPPGFSSLATSPDNSPNGQNASTCSRSGSYLESNRDECTVSLIYTVHLKKLGSVYFDYQYVDNSIFFEFFIQNDQCQEMDQDLNKKWIKLTTHGEWGTHSASQKLHTTTIIIIIIVIILFLNTLRLELPFESLGTFKNVFESLFLYKCCLSQTQVIYKWVEPQICLAAAAGTVTLPPSDQREPCPPCNPGFYNNDTATCSPCPPGTYSDGVKACQPCPAGTEPVLVYEYKWWNVLPANMKTSCFNVANNNCDGLNGWEVAGDHVQSGAGRSDNDYLILTLTVPGFKLPVSVRGASGSEYSRITFEFETSCSADCEFYFMTDVNRRSTNVIESWEGSKSKQSYTHIMTEDSSVAFTWAFQRTSQLDTTLIKRPTSAKSALLTPSYLGITSMAKKRVSRVGQAAKATSALNSAGSIMNGPSFTAKGTKYYHLFNISLCGAEGHKAAVCRDNVTNLPNEDAEGGQLGSSVEAFLCQSTIIPSDGRGLRTALSSQSISLADTFQGATVEKSLNGITTRPELFPSASERIPDVHFFYRYCECPAGTCDGCTFHFLWESSSACPRCTAVDYHAIEGACKAGVQYTVFVWTEPRLCTGGLTLPLKRTSPCEAIDFWLKVGAGLGAFCAILLVSLTCYFWKKNKKLEYKYSKLVMSANKECELPAADSCAIMEGEGDENEEEEVVYANKSSLLAKLKAIATKVS